MKHIKLFSKGTIVGMTVMMVTGIIMALLVLVSKPVPDVIAWIFCAGLVISFVSAIVANKKQ